MMVWFTAVILKPAMPSMPNSRVFRYMVPQLDRYTRCVRMGPGRGYFPFWALRTPVTEYYSH